MASVGSRGDSHDNALAESGNGLYKAEVIHHRSWRSLEQVELATAEWVDWWNHRRLHSAIDSLPPRACRVRGPLLSPARGHSGRVIPSRPASKKLRAVHLSRTGF